MTGSLFDGPRAGAGDPPGHAPLAERLRPRTLDEVVGHADVIGPGTVLRRLIDEDRLPSLLLWGPPGVGKTSLARALAEGRDAEFETVSAVLDGLKQVREVIARAERRRSFGRRTLLFVDEIHRFNRAQQDAFLPHVESGLVTLVGATTENPGFHVIRPLLSRCRLVRLEPLARSDRDELVTRALSDTERGLGVRELTLPQDARELLLDLTDGDGRATLNVLEASAGAVADRGTIDAETVRAAAGARTMAYDRAGDAHYQLASALQKSIRAGDVQAGLYWCARMLQSGEDPLFVARRLVVIASEDVGMAQPFLLPIVIAARDAVQFLGMPEGRYALLQAVVALASAPKSRSLPGAWSALEQACADGASPPVPEHLRPRGEGGLADPVAGNLPARHRDAAWYVPSGSGREVDVAGHIAAFERRMAERRAETAGGVS